MVKQGDITVGKLVFYNVVFFVPIGLSLAISLFLAPYFSPVLQVSSGIVVALLMFFFTGLIFLFIIPYLKKKERMKGVRYALVAFLVVSLTMTIPPMFRGSFRLFFLQLIPIANYILLTFIFAPDVLGIYSDIKDWFRHNRQIIILLIYLLIIWFYFLGFAWMYFEVHNDTANAFALPEGEATLSTFIYYSVITFATIGYGDITPLSPAARFIATTEGVVGMVVNVLFIAILLVFVSSVHGQILAREEMEEKELSKIEKQEKVEIKAIGRMKKRHRAKGLKKRR